MNEEIPTEKIFGDFLELLEADSQDQYTGFLFKFITQIIAQTMNLGKDGFAPLLNFTVYAKQAGVDGFELIVRPSRCSDPDSYQALKLGAFGNKIMEAFKSYAIENWGMTPVVDEREDLRAEIDPTDIVAQWEGIKE